VCGVCPTPPHRGDCSSTIEAYGEVDVTAGTRSAGKWVRGDVANGVTGGAMGGVGVDAGLLSEGVESASLSM
jgi:hypothetical protein